MKAKRFIIIPLSLSLAVLVGGGCQKNGSVGQEDFGKPPGVTFAPLQTTSEELHLSATSTEESPDETDFRHGQVANPYLVTVLENKTNDLKSRLFVYDVVQKATKRIIDDFFYLYDPYSYRVNNGRLFMIENQAGSSLEEGPLFTFDIATGVLTPIPLSASLKAGSFDVDGKTLVIQEPRASGLNLYDISNARSPKLVDSIAVTGTVEALSISNSLVIWSEATRAVDGFQELKIRAYDMKRKTRVSLQDDHRIQTGFATDGSSIAFLAQGRACVVGLKNGPAGVTPENLADNLKTDCSTGSAQKEIIVTDFTGATLASISDESANDLSLSDGMLAWQDCGSLGKSCRLRMYDIQRKQFFELTPSEKDASFVHPDVVKDGILYLETSDAYHPALAPRIMLAPWHR